MAFYHFIAYIKTYFESKGTQARRKKKDPAIWKTLSKNKRRIQVSVPVISLQRFYGFEILWELKTDKARYLYKILNGLILNKKDQICYSLHFFKNFIFKFLWKSKTKCIAIKFLYEPLV